jgi:hypothetical protein
MKKLSPILQELEDVRKKRGLTLADLQLDVRCSIKTLYNWLSYRTSEPSRLWRREIRKAIRRIENRDPKK